ncbi:MAG TPA: hypothetical protein VMU10_00920 [Desulfomonilia bacterium]|nr:hypothetical protein [Desulfomonilia bacterium]
MPDLDLVALPQEAAAAFRPFAEELVKRFSTRLLSITVVGSCLTGDYISGVSDINSVLVLTEADIPELDTLASLSHFKKKHIRSPLIMTEEYISRSLDVFPIEFLDIKLIHKTVHGPDFFENLSIDKAPLRLQCERDLKGKLIHLKRGYVACEGKLKGLKAILLEAIPGYFPLLRAMLYLVQSQEPPARKTDVLAKAEAEFHIPLTVLREIVTLKGSRFSLNRDHILNLFREVSRITYELSVATDALVV